MHRVTAVVIVPPSTPFPFDMLRYDCCWPTVESEARDLSDGQDRDEGREHPKRVHVAKWTDKPKSRPFEEKWTVRRWESMGIRIEETS